jgi:hypothetical protein
MSRKIWLLVIGAGALVLGTALIGLAHTPMGRPLMSALRGLSGCPVDLGVDDVERLRQRGLADVEGTTVSARARSALGFELGTDTRASVLDRLGPAKRDCVEKTLGAALECPPTAFTREGEMIGALKPEAVYLQFDARDRLVALDRFQHAPNGHAAIVYVDELSERLSDSVGTQPNGHTRGSAAELEHTTLSRHGYEFETADYVVRISATNLGQRGIKVREQYQWIPKPEETRPVETL